MYWLVTYSYRCTNKNTINFQMKKIDYCAYNIRSYTCLLVKKDRKVFKKLRKYNDEK